MQKTLQNIARGLSLTWYAVVYVLLIGLFCHVLEIPEIIKAFLALPGFIVIPLVCGSITIHFISNFSNKKHLKFINSLLESLDTLSLHVLKWCLGSLFLFILPTMFSLFFIFNFNMFCLVILSMLIVYLIISICHTSRHKNLKKAKSECKKKVMLIILPTVLFIGLLPTLWFKLYSIFPLQYYNPSFVIHSHQILRIIENNLLNYTLESYLPFFYLLFAIVSKIFDVHPYSLFWTFPFICSPLWSLGLFYFTKKITNNISESLLSAFLGSYLFSGGYFISNFMITQRGLEIILFPFLIYLVICVIEMDKIKKELTFSKIFMVLLLTVVLFIPGSFIGFQRVIEGNMFFIKNTFMEIYVISLLGINFIFLQKLNNPHTKTLFLLLFLMVFSLWIIHMADSSVAFVMLAFFLISLSLNLRRVLTSSFISLAITLILFIWIYLQKAKVIVLPPEFVITDILLRGAFSGSKYQVGFDFKYGIFTRTFPEIFFFMFIAISILLAILNYKKHERSSIYLLSASSAGALGLLIFFTPDPVLYRVSGYFAPFVITTLSYGLISSIRALNRIILNVFKSKNMLMLILIFILTISIFPLAVNSFYNYSMYRVSAGISDKLINEAPYEYEAAIWLKQNLPRTTFIISDIWTRRYIIGLTNFIVTDEDNPWDRLRFDETSFRVIPSYGHFVKQLKLILSKDNSYDLYCSIKNLTKSKNIIIVVSGRTESWVNKKDLSFENDMHHGVSEKFLSKFLDRRYFTPLFSIDNKIYIFGVNPKPGELFKIEKGG